MRTIQRLFALLCAVCAMASPALAGGDPDPRPIDLSDPTVTQGQAAFGVTAPDAAVFSFLNSGTNQVQGTLSLNLTGSPIGSYEVLWNVYSTEALALAGGAGDLFSSSLLLSVSPDSISTGNGESLNYLSNFLFQLDGSGPGTLWASASLSNGALGLANLSDPLGNANYLIQDNMAFAFDDIGLQDKSWAVSLRIVPAPGSAALFGLGGLLVARRRR